MKNKLNDIASISFGVYIPSSDKGSIPYLQAGDFDEDGQLRPGAPYITTNPNNVDDKFFVRPDDVLLSGKGVRNQAIHYKPHYPEALASSIFFIIRITDQNILPAFLAIYLNHTTTQNKLRAKIGSSVTVPTINKKDLLDLIIPIPPLAIQHRLISVFENWYEEKKLTQQLITQKENLLLQIFTEQIQPTYEHKNGKHRRN